MIETRFARAEEINRLHATARRFAGESREMLNGALVAAWEAGKLLLEEKKQVTKLGAGAWGQWLDLHFAGSKRTAQRYMKLAALVGDVSQMRDASLRQAYGRLGIATEPKRQGGSVRYLPPIPGHALHANRLLRALKKRRVLGAFSSTESTGIRSDLREVYQLLKRLFEPERE